MRAVLVAVSVLTVSSAAFAQKATVEELEARVAKLEAEAGTQAQGVGDLTAQIAAMRQEIDAMRKAQGASPELTARLDGLDARLIDLSKDVASLRAAVQAGSAPEAAAPATGGAAWSDGFVLETPDGRFRLRTRGFVEVRHQTRLTETFDDVNEAGFSLRRARIGWDGNVWTPSLGYKVVVELAREVEMLDYFVEGKLGPVVLRAGQYKVPFSRIDIASDETMSFLERPIAADEFRYDRDIGVTASGRWLDGRVEAIAGVFNGAGENVARNDNRDPLFVLRVAGTPLGQSWRFEEGDARNTETPALSIGAAVTFENAPVPDEYDYASPASTAPEAGGALNTDVDADGVRDNVRVVQATADLAFRFRGVGVEAEGYLRKESWGLIGEGQTTPFDPDDTFLGGFVQASYFVVPARFQLGARASWTEVSPLTLAGRRRAAPPVSDTARELSAIVSYYRHGHAIELTAMYSFIDWGNEDGAAPKGVGEQRLIVECQIGF